MRQSHHSSSRAYAAPTQFINPLAIQTSFHSFDNGLTSPTSPTSSISSNGGDSMFDFNDDFYLPSADSLFDDSWLSYPTTSSPQSSPTYYNPNAHQYLDPIAEELEQPLNTRPAKRRKTQVEPCPCCYCQVPSTPSDSSVPSSRKSNAGKIGSSSGGGVMQPTPPLQLQFQIELTPNPTIIGYEALGADSVFLQQQLQIQQARQYMKPSDGYDSGRMDGFDGRPFFGDARTYM
ncbi:hypothetical protein BJ508DRAFT_410017 [Ascobolus immersus RN42]|uniref:Uncharacterized protein n=1 Tax=Ascobolus immersus RN42 TaxID=1160509 RepID=A0A3N4J2M0_ASCIM|nr:hypothetical protein BJ508DRAFT_410017 [Ascobolus immersus RN42]